MEFGRRFFILSLLLLVALLSLGFGSAYMTVNYGSDYMKDHHGYYISADRTYWIDGRDYYVQSDLRDYSRKNVMFSAYENGDYPYSNWRYKSSYRYYDYGSDEYTESYYYQPRYDWLLNEYNWRY